MNRIKSMVQCSSGSAVKRSVFDAGLLLNCYPRLLMFAKRWVSGDGARAARERKSEIDGTMFGLGGRRMQGFRVGIELQMTGYRPALDCRRGNRARLLPRSSRGAGRRRLLPQMDTNTDETQIGEGNG
jgi:hypothetical protein